MRKFLSPLVFLVLSVAASLLPPDMLLSAAASDGTSDVPTATGSIDANILNAGSNWIDTQWILTCGYHACGDGGGGKLHRETCTPDNIFCFADSAGHTFARSDQPVASTIDAVIGGVVENGTTVNAATLLNTILTAAAAKNIDTVSICSNALFDGSANINVPNGVQISGCDSASGVRGSNDYTIAGGITGVVGIPSTVKFVLNRNSGIQHVNILRSDGDYSPLTFVPASLRDGINERKAFAGTAISIAASSTAARIEDVGIFGFDRCIDSNGKSLDWHHVFADCTNAFRVDGSGDVTHLSDLESVAYLTKGMAEKWAIDSLRDDGAGHYEVVGSVQPSDMQWLDGDVGYIQTLIGVNGGAQSAGGEHTFVCTGAGGACRTVPNGTEGCVTAGGCEVADLPDTNSGNNAVVATWSAGARIDGSLQPLAVVSGSVANLSVGQALTTSVSCSAGNNFPSNTTIANVNSVGGVTYITPSAANRCSGSSATVNAIDSAFVRSKRGIEINAVQRHGIGFECFRSGGITVVNLHLYVFDDEEHIGDGCNQVREVAPSFGENDPLDEGGLITILIDGNHAGNDGGNVFASDAIIGQHTGFAINVNSDSAGTNRFVNCGIGPSSGKDSGIMFRVDAGNLQLANCGASAAGDLIVADGSTFTVTQIDPKNQGGSYVAGVTLTGVSGGGASCTGAYPQGVVDKVDSTGEITAWHETVAGVGCTIIGLSMATTSSGAGTGAKLIVDGFVPSVVEATNMLTPQGNWFIQTPRGSSFSGANNVCLNMDACNSTHANLTGGVNITGTEQIKGVGSMRLYGDVAPTTPFVACSICDVQHINPSGTATAVGGEQMLIVIGDCNLCGTTGDPTLFGAFQYGGHLEFNSTDHPYTGPNPIPSIWESNLAPPTWGPIMAVGNHVYIAAPGGPYCDPLLPPGVTKCSFIDAVGPTDIPGAGGDMTIHTASFGVPSGSPNQLGSDLHARAIVMTGICGTPSGGAAEDCFALLGVTTATSQLAGNLQSSDSGGWRLDAGACVAGLADIEPSRAMTNSGLGSHDCLTSNWSLDAATVEDMWGNSTSVNFVVQTNMVDASNWSTQGLALGAATHAQIGSNVPSFEVEGTSAATRSAVARWSADIGPPFFSGYKSRAVSIGMDTAVQAGDGLVTLGGYGSDGTTPGGDLAANIAFTATNTFAVGNFSGAINFKTSTGGALNTVLALDGPGAACVASSIGGTATCAANKKIFDQLGNLYLNGGLIVANLLESATAPTVASGFGTSPSIPKNNGTAAFTVNVGTGGSATSGVIGLPTAANGWICLATDMTTPGANFTKQSASSTTSATFTNYNSAGSATAWAANDNLIVHCQGY